MTPPAGKPRRRCVVRSAALCLPLLLSFGRTARAQGGDGAPGAAPPAPIEIRYRAPTEAELWANTPAPDGAEPAAVGQADTGRSYVPPGSFSQPMAIFYGFTIAARRVEAGAIAQAFVDHWLAYSRALELLNAADLEVTTAGERLLACAAEVAKWRSQDLAPTGLVRHRFAVYAASGTEAWVQDSATDDVYLLNRDHREVLASDVWKPAAGPTKTPQDFLDDASEPTGRCSARSSRTSVSGVIPPLPCAWCLPSAGTAWNS